MTKGLPTLTYSEFRSSLYVTTDPSTAGGLEIYVSVYVSLVVFLYAKAYNLYASYIYT
jgi:hypothetical protein